MPLGVEKAQTKCKILLTELLWLEREVRYNFFLMHKEIHFTFFTFEHSSQQLFCNIQNIISKNRLT